LADRLCVPLTETEIITHSDIKTECGVKAHNGPLAEGWESNSQWKTDPVRGKPNGFPNERIDYEDAVF